MRRLLKWFGIVVGVLLLIIVVAAVVLYFVGRNNLGKTYEVSVETLVVPDDEAARERGKHLAVAVSLCAACHGDDLGGEDFLDEPIFGEGYAPNLTTGAGGIGAEYETEDWVRAIRHGVKSNGEAIRFMPSQFYYHLSDSDLGALVAYVQSVPPVDREAPELSLGPLGTILMGVMADLPVEEIDHTAARPVAPEEGVTAEYGEYLVTLAACRDCHGDKLDGDTPPMAPGGPNLTQGGELGEWNEQDFINTLRQGIAPDGKKLDPDEMPWDYYTRMTDDELKAIWMYLQTLE